MSLTAFITRPDIQAAWTRHGVVPSRPANLPRRVVAPVMTPPDGSEPDWALIGTAFDYALRFKLLRLGEQDLRLKLHRHGETFAERSLALMRRGIPGRPRVPEAKINRAEIRMDQVLGILRADREAPPEKHLDDRRLATMCLWLANLDSYGRSGICNPEAEIRAVSVTDVANLLAVTDIAALAAAIGPSIALNPGLALADRVGGADCDLAGSHSVVDIKTSMRSPVTAANMLQLAGYAIMMRAGGLLIAKGWRDIRAVGLYSARHACLMRWPLDALFHSPDDRQAFETVFCRAAGIALPTTPFQPARSPSQEPVACPPLQ